MKYYLVSSFNLGVKALMDSCNRVYVTEESARADVEDGQYVYEIEVKSKRVANVTRFVDLSSE